MKIKIGKLTVDIQIYWEKTYIKQVKDALRAGYKIKAVKIYKDATGLGLRESKAAVDEMEMYELIKRSKKYNSKLSVVRDDIAKFQATQFNK